MRRFDQARLPLVTMSMAVAALGIACVPGAAEHLQFERVALADGQWWRAITGHSTHFDLNHLAWDVGALLALGIAAERASRIRVAVALAGAALGISAAVWWGAPHLSVYRGLSGLDSALFGLLAASLITRPHGVARFVGTLALLGAMGKCAVEAASGATIFARGDGYEPVPLAHLVGIAAGVITAWIPSRLFRPQKSDSRNPPPCPSRRLSPTPAPLA